MAKFKVRFSGTGSAETADPEILDFKNESEACDWAYQEALDELDSYGGLHGYPSSEDCSWETFQQEAESWIDIEVELIEE
jgi:hypothetical protein